MNIRDLRYLVALADHCHFGNAARASFVSQPALSMQIKKLESHLGVQLLERTNKSVRLTEAGKVMAERARLILTQVEEMQETAKLINNPESGELKLGIFPTLAPYLLPFIMPALSESFPKLSFYLIEEKTGILVEQLKQGKLDAAILALPITETGIISTPLFEEEFMLAVSHAHPLAKQRLLNQESLENKTLLLLEEGHCLRNQALSLCHKVHAHETQNFRATSLETLRHMVAALAGMTIMPKLACHPHEKIRYIPFEKPKPARLIGLLWRISTPKQNLLKKIEICIRKEMKKQKLVKIYTD